MSFNVEDIQKYVPYYLTQPQKEELAKAIASFPDCKNYFIRGFEDTVLQGDVWSDLRVTNFESGQHRHVKGILLSNSCDISSENARAVIPKVVFAPIVPLSAYTAMLTKNGQNQAQIESKLRDFRAQRPSSFFYLPAGGTLAEEHIVALDDVHSIPLSYFEKSTKKQKVATLSQVGFYVFLVKLTIHFCRMHEAVPRFDVRPSPFAH